MKELEAIPESWQPLLKVAKEKPLVLLYSAKDEKQNNAVVLMEFLQKQCKTS
ncbi:MULTISPECIES: DUF488 family protein, N3 subclade [Enterobacterales]|uniref:DUF488 family protein, N3 subclade n=1 Tax=Enterobacterales TaxID=91347 RepID=UPI0031583781